MKKYFYFAVAALALSACTSDELVGVIEPPEQEVEEVLAPIAFGSKTSGMTRADHVGSDAAGLLGNNFVVEGIKGDGNYTTLNNAIEDFDHYNVNYVEGTANTTESNVHNWEYVGETKHELSAASQQTIKYWDFEVAQYDFIAFSYGKAVTTGTPATPTVTLSKINYKNLGKATSTGTPVYTVSGTSDELAKTYVADLLTVKKADFNKMSVTPKFRSLGSKIRVAFYETVPGYSVKDVKFYSSNVRGTASTDATLYTETAAIPTGSGTMSVYYPTVGNPSNKDNNQAHIVFAETASTDLTTTMDFGALKYTESKESAEANGTEFLGRTSNNASYATATDAAGAYKTVLPTGTGEPLRIHVDYTLVPIDGAAGEIHVKSAVAVVPANYTEWKPNYAYTYIFKISDQSNGTTGNIPNNVDTDGDGILDAFDPDHDTDGDGIPDVDDPDYPGPVDPVGLYPITFDAVVSETEDGLQETITTVSNPSITTYQEGKVVTTNDEYVAGKPIYVENAVADMYATSTATGVTPAHTANVKLYTAIDLGAATPATNIEGITEKTVANYMNNDIILTDVTSMLTEVTKVDGVDSPDGNDMPLTKAGVKFTPAAGTVYVVEFTDAQSNKSYKVIKVTGTVPTVSYTLALATSAPATIAEGESTTVVVKEGTNVVTGAQKLFTGADDFTIVETATPGTYTFTAKIKTGANNGGAKSIQLNGSTALSITINAYEFATAALNTIQGATAATITLNLNGSDATDVDAATNFVITGTGLSISGVTDGVVTVAAADDAANGTIEYQVGTNVVAKADITVNPWTLTCASPIINGIGNTTTVVLKDGNGAFAAATTTLTSTTPTTATIAAVTGAAGEATVTSVAVGTTKIQKGSASVDIEVTNFAVAFFTDPACTAAATTFTKDAAVYVKFTDNTVAKYVSGLTTDNGTITQTSGTGIYKVVPATAGTDALNIKYTYKGQTLTLATETVVAPTPAP